MPPRPPERHGLPLLLVALLTVSVQACTFFHYPENTQNEVFDAEGGYRFDALGHDPEADSLFVCLAFSAGGTRAATFASFRDRTFTYSMTTERTARS